MRPAGRQPLQPRLMRPGFLLLLLLLQLLTKAAMSFGLDIHPDGSTPAAAAANEEIMRQKPAPVIGVLMQSVDDNLPGKVSGVSREQLESEGVSYIAASYIKYIEAAGCVAFPIPLELSEEEHKSLFNQLDGLLLPGGGADLSGWDKPYLKITKLYYDLAVEANARGMFFPIIAICLGFEALLIAASGNLDYFEQLYNDDLDKTRLLSFHPDAENSVLLGSGMFLNDLDHHPPTPKSLREEKPRALKQMQFLEATAGGEREAEGESDGESDEESGGLATLRSVFSVDLIKKLLATHRIAYFHHSRHLSLDEFNADNKLKSEWFLLATTKLPKDNFVEIVAAVEHKKYPFFGFQFHPEKALFEHCPKSRIPHFFMATLPSLYISAFISLAARRSRNTFKDEKQKFDGVAFAFTPTRTATYDEFYAFEQTYLFSQDERQEMRKQLANKHILSAQQQRAAAEEA